MQDDKVGAALSMTYITGQPILFVGCGQVCPSYELSAFFAYTLIPDLYRSQAPEGKSHRPSVVVRVKGRLRCTSFLIPYYNNNHAAIHAPRFSRRTLSSLLFRRQKRERLVPDFLGSSVDHVSVARDHSVEIPLAHHSYVPGHRTVKYVSKRSCWKSRAHTPCLYLSYSE